MKKNLTNILIITFFLIILVFIFFNSNLIITEIINIIYIWIKKLFPSLFPFFIISDILINYNFVYYLSYIFSPLIKFLFNANGNISFIFLLSMLSGFPSNAKYTKELYLNKYLNIEESSYALAYTFFSNPLFIITMTKIIFNNSKITLIIILSHYLSNILIGFLFRFIKHEESNNNVLKKESLPFNKLLSTSIAKNIDTLLLILGTIILFVILATCISKLLSLNIFSKTLISGILELTQGINSLKLINISIHLKIYLAVIFLSFGGLSVHMQIKSILEDTPISLKPFYIGRFLHIIFAIILAKIFMVMLY